jgi:hypothetical protein
MKTMEVIVPVKGEGNEISWRELLVLALAAAGGVASVLLFQGLNPGWDQVGHWPAAAWLAAGAVLACVAGFLATVYRCYLKRRYGRLAPVMLVAFVLLHAVGALLVMARAG